MKFSAFSRIIDLIFPPRCLGCGSFVSARTAACASCLNAVRVNSALFCGACRARIPGGLAGANTTREGKRRTCHKSFPYILGAATNYDDPLVRSLIHGLKFESIRAAASPLADFLVSYLEGITLPFPADRAIVVPIPLGKRRLLRRGFNQSLLIGELFARRLGVTILPDVLIRTRETEPQTALRGLEERRGNIAGCFGISAPERVKRRAVILVDDVITSGATAYEAAASLKRAGARTVLLLAAAKA